METTYQARPELESSGQPAERKNIGSLERILSVALGAVALLEGIRRGGLPGVVGSLGGSALLYRGASGHCGIYERLGINRCHGNRASLLSRDGIEVFETITINRSPEEVYRYWKDFQNLPKFMKHLSRVDVREDGITHWVVTGPAGKTIEWNARIIAELPNELIAWETLPGGDVESKGSVRFEAAPGGRGTILKVLFMIRPPYGKLGLLAARLFRKAPEEQLKEDLRRLRQLLEAGEVATAER